MSQNNCIDAKCSKCGKCCTTLLPMSDFEIERIKKYIKRHNIQAVNRNTNSNDKYVDVCPFLTEENICSIYNYRPEVCEWFSCSGSPKKFRHGDKSIVNVFSTFFPEISINNLPNVKLVNELYQEKKCKAKIAINKKK